MSKVASNRGGGDSVCDSEPPKYASNLSGGVYRTGVSASSRVAFEHEERWVARLQSMHLVHVRMPKPPA